MSTEKIRILNQEQIDQRISRMAYQIYEQNFEEEELIIAGILKRGFLLSQMVTGELRKITEKKIRLVELDLNNKDPFAHEVSLNMDLDELEDKPVIIVDDVINSGKTLFYATRPFQKVRVGKLQILVLVHRSHSRYPVKPDFIGLSLATTIQEHVHVNIEGSDMEVLIS